MADASPPHAKRHWVPVTSINCGIPPACVAFSHSSSTFSIAGPSAVVIATEAPICVSSRAPLAAVQSSSSTVSIFRAATGAGMDARGSSATPFTVVTADSELRPAGIDVSEGSLAIWDAARVEVHSMDASRHAATDKPTPRNFPHAAPSQGIAVHNDLLFRCTRGGVEAVAVETGDVRTTLQLPHALGQPVALSINGQTLAAATSELYIRTYSLRGRGLKESNSGQVRFDGTDADKLRARVNSERVSVATMHVAPSGAHCAMLFVPAGLEPVDGCIESLVAVHDLESGTTLTHGALHATRQLAVFARTSYMHAGACR